MRLPVAACTLALSIAFALSGGAASAQDAPASPVAAAAPAGQADVQARLDAWFAEKYQEQLRFSPISLTFLGRKELYDQLDDMSYEAADRQLAWQKATVDELEREFDRDALDPEAQLSYDLWKLQY
jgi:uncharacterized protein (DUF885 family)